jgi:putative membrane protein
MGSYEVGFDYENGVKISYLTNIVCGSIAFACIPCLCFPCVAYCTSKSVRSQECSVDDKRIHFKSGWINKQDKMIPLDRIQDLNIVQGWFSRLMGVSHIAIQTAGNSNQGGLPEAYLHAVKEPIQVRDEIMTRRDRMVLGGPNTTEIQQPKLGPIMSTSPSLAADIHELKEAVLRIEKVFLKKYITPE